MSHAETRLIRPNSHSLRRLEAIRFAISIVRNVSPEPFVNERLQQHDGDDGGGGDGDDDGKVPRRHLRYKAGQE